MTELRFDGRVAIVTGAGRGLGRAYAMLLASRGASVIVNDLGAALDGSGSDTTPAESVAAEIVAAGGQAVANGSTVATEAGAAEIVEQAITAFGGIHLIVNNAGNFTDSRPFLETSSASFESLWRVHVMGAINVIRAAWPHLIARHYGRIVNIGSHGGYYGHKGKFEYATVKAAIHGLTLTLAMEGGEHGVHVNVVAPGAATRPVLSWAPKDMFAVDGFQPDLVAPTACWLLHEDCPANGQSFSAIAGNTSRVIIAETSGFQSRTPSIEEIAGRFADISAVERDGASNLVFPAGAIERGGELIGMFDALADAAS